MTDKQQKMHTTGTEADQFSRLEITTFQLLSNSIRNTLRRNGIRTLGELRSYAKDRSLASLSNIGSVSVEVLADFIQNPVKYLPQNTFLPQDCDNSSVPNTSKVQKSKKPWNVIAPVFQHIHEELKPLPLSIFYLHGQQKGLVEPLRRNGYTKLGELENIPFAQFMTLVGKEKATILLEMESTLTLPLAAVAKIYIDELDETLKQPLLSHAHGHSLQKISESRGLSIETVRQKEKSALRHLSIVLEPLLSRLLSEKGIIFLSELDNFWGNCEQTEILMYWAKNNPHLTFYKPFDVLLPGTTDTDCISEKLLAIAEAFVGPGIFLQEKLPELKKLLRSLPYDFVTTDNFLNFIQQNKYFIHGNILEKDRINYGFLCAALIHLYFPSGFRTGDADDMVRLRKLFRQVYGCELTYNRSLLFTRLRENTRELAPGILVALDDIPEDFLRTVQKKLKISGAAGSPMTEN